jgi:hemerythrin
MEPWNPSLDVGHPEMDGEHRGLYGHAVAAAEGVERQDQAAVKAELSVLFTSSEAHFRHEEALMVESGFEGLPLHREAHRAFMEDFLKLRQELEARGLSPLFRLWLGARFVDWFRYHIRGQDTQFYRHLRQWQEAQARQAEARLVAQAKAEAAPAGEPRPVQKKP